MIKAKKTDILFTIAVFAVLFVFLYVAHPLFLFDSDDWEMCSYFRRPLPIFGGYNGIKVFPETFYPILTEIAANFVYPVMKDYLKSLAFVFAITGALFITMYVRVMVLLVKKMLGESEKIKANFLGICFLAFHFLIFKNDWYNNTHLFWSEDVTCFMHYVITAVVNATAVMWFINKDMATDSGDKIGSIELKNGFIFLLIYFIVFSNMFTNIIFVSYAGVEILLALIGTIKDRADLKKALIQRWYFIATLIMWFAAVAIQAVDPRNADAKKQIVEKIGVIDVIRAFAGNVASVNKMFLLIVFAVLVMFAACMIRCKGRVISAKEKMLLVKVLLSGIITVIYLVILSAFSDMYYITRRDVSLGVYFYAFIFVITVFSIVLKSANDSKSYFEVVLPFLTFVLVAQTVNSCRSYRDYNGYFLSKEQTYAVGNDILNQYREADEAGLEAMELVVPDNSKTGNTWPYTFYLGDAISDTLFRHGIISRFIDCEVIYDIDKNNEFHIKF